MHSLSLSCLYDFHFRTMVRKHHPKRNKTVKLMNIMQMRNCSSGIPCRCYYYLSDAELSSAVVRLAILASSESLSKSAIISSPSTGAATKCYQCTSKHAKISKDIRISFHLCWEAQISTISCNSPHLLTNQVETSNMCAPRPQN
jgi:hypothetical protein